MQGPTEPSAEAALRSIHPSVCPPASPSSIHLPPSFSLTPSLLSFSLPSFIRPHSTSVLPSICSHPIHLSFIHLPIYPSPRCAIPTEASIPPSFLPSTLPPSCIHYHPPLHPAVVDRPSAMLRCWGSAPGLLCALGFLVGRQTLRMVPMVVSAAEEVKQSNGIESCKVSEGTSDRSRLHCES